MALPDKFRIVVTEQLFTTPAPPHPPQYGACSGHKSALVRFRRTVGLPPGVKLVCSDYKHHSDGSSHYEFKFKASGQYIGCVDVYPTQEGEEA